MYLVLRFFFYISVYKLNYWMFSSSYFCKLNHFSTIFKTKYCIHLMSNLSTCSVSTWFLRIKQVISMILNKGHLSPEQINEWVKLYTMCPHTSEPDYSFPHWLELKMCNINKLLLFHQECSLCKSTIIIHQCNILQFIIPLLCWSLLLDT